MDTYRNFQELAQHEEEGRDFRIEYRDLDAAIAVLAPHGGDIEPGTIDIAEALAGSEFTFYAFRGMKDTGNRRLHLTSNRFDEPIGLKLAGKSAVVVTVHGNHEEREAVLVGGLHRVLKERLVKALTAAGFQAEIGMTPGLRGIDPNNLCNRGRRGGGVQLEISRGLRQRLFEDFDSPALRKKTLIFSAFVDTIRKTLFAQAN